jgi:hypothetical protein
VRGEKFVFVWVWSILACFESWIDDFIDLNRFGRLSWLYRIYWVAGDVVLGVGVRVGVVGGVVRDYHGGGTVEKVCDVVRVETRRKKMIKLREIDAIASLGREMSSAIIAFCREPPTNILK